MTKNELVWGAGSLVVGVLVGGLLLRHCDHPSKPHASADSDSGTVPLEEIPVAPSDDVDAGGDAYADVPLDDPSKPPSHTPHGHHHDASAPKDAAEVGPPDTAPLQPPPPKDAGHTPPAAVLSEQNLLIRPVSSPGECVDAPSRSPNLTLHGCHGRANQRWTFTEDTSGTSQISGGGGGCIRLGRGAENVPILQIGACGAGTARFRHTEDRKLVEVQSGQCVTAERIGKNAKLLLEECDASNTGQRFALTQ